MSVLASFMNLGGPDLIIILLIILVLFGAKKLQSRNSKRPKTNSVTSCTRPAKPTPQLREICHRHRPSRELTPQLAPQLGPIKIKRLLPAIKPIRCELAGRRAVDAGFH